MTEQSATIKPTKVGTNPLNIEWPTDEHGITSTLKREGCRAVGRISGDPEKLETFLATMRVIAAHAKERFEEQVIERKARSEHISASDKAAVAVSEAMRQSSIKRLENQLKRLKEVK